jgi:hypothetical protein
MAINRSNPDRWKEDIVQSVDLYNSWFMEFAPKAFRVPRNSDKHSEPCGTGVGCDCKFYRRFF